jgi:hypothetical protein
MQLENILLSGDLRSAKLADFGLHKRARVNTATGQLTSPVPTTLTLSAIPTLPHDLSMLAVRTPSISPLPGSTGNQPSVSAVQVLQQGHGTAVQDRTVNGKQPGITAGLPQYSSSWAAMAALDNDRSYYGGNAYYASLGMGAGPSVHAKASTPASLNSTAHAGHGALAALAASNTAAGAGSSTVATAGAGSTIVPAGSGGSTTIPGIAAAAGAGSGSGRRSGGGAPGLAAGETEGSILELRCWVLVNDAVITSNKSSRLSTSQRWLQLMGEQQQAPLPT